MTANEARERAEQIWPGKVVRLVRDQHLTPGPGTEWWIDLAGEPGGAHSLDSNGHAICHWECQWAEDRMEQGEPAAPGGPRGTSRRSRRGAAKKPAMMASAEFARMFSQVSKQTLVDALWCACQLGTNESREEITTQAARNVQAALLDRGDRIPKDIVEAAARRIDSDPEP